MVGRLRWQIEHLRMESRAARDGWGTIGTLSGASAK